jgi:hypothetical protein
MNASSTARRAAAPASIGPCNPSPVHNSLRTDASNRPYTLPGERPSARTFKPARARCVRNVRSPGTRASSPPAASMISLTCAAVRSGRPRFKENASSSTPAGVRGATTRGRGTSASNPPRRYARIHSSNVPRATRTGRPSGPTCSRSLRARTSRPRSAFDRPGSAASRISAYRNSPISRRPSSPISSPNARVHERRTLSAHVAHE